MAFPVDGLPIDPPIVAPFIPPNNRTRVPFEDWSRGGVGIQDASLGLNVHNWSGFLDEETNELNVGVTGVIPFAAVYEFTNPLTEIAFSFDTNMNLVIGWVEENDDAWFRWFDPTIPGNVNVPLPAGSQSVRVAIDDVRGVQALSGVTDTIIAYMRDGTVYYRQLRDRFDDEHEFSSGHTGLTIGQIGMNEKLRFQFQLVAGSVA